MFFIFGINQQEKKLNYNSKLYIHDCGKYGKIEIYMVYMVLSLFFIPTLKWRKKYFAKYTCCNTIYELDSDIGRDIEKGYDRQIREEDLHSSNYKTQHLCPSCGYPINNDFDYCPKCGNKIDTL